VTLILFLLFSAGPADASPSVDRLARAVVDQATRIPLEAPVAIQVDAPTPALGRAVASLISAELSRRRLSPVVLDANAVTAERLAREKDLRSLLRVSVTAENARLAARGDVLPTWVNFWAGAAPTRSGPAAAIAASVDADVQAMTLAATVAAGSPSAPLKLGLGVLAKLPGVPAAIAVGDLDGDKRPEIAVLMDDELLVLSSEGKPIARYDLRSLAVALRPTREPFGAVSILTGRLTYVSGRRAHGETLTLQGGSLKPVAVSDDVTLDAITVRLVPGLNAFAAEASWFGKPLSLPALLTTTSTRAGLSLFLFANGSGSITRGTPPAAAFTSAPSAAVLADLDGDQSPELVTTSSRFFVDGDDVRVVPVAAAEAIAARSGSLADATPVFSGATPRGRVLAIAAADLDGDGTEEVVLGAWLADGTGELLLARRVAP